MVYRINFDAIEIQENIKMIKESIGDIQEPSFDDIQDIFEPDIERDNLANLDDEYTMTYDPEYDDYTYSENLDWPNDYY